MIYHSVALFCGSCPGNNPIYAQQAAAFGHELARRNITLYYGGAGIGLMGAAADALLQDGGEAIGIAPDFFKEGAVLASNISEMIYVKTMSERKQMLETKADAFVIFPGSYGTMDEFFEIMTDAQLGMHSKPIVIYNLNGYYDLLLEQLKRFRADGFLRPFHHDLLVSAENLDELFDKLDNYTNSNDQTWLHKVKHIR